MDNKYSAIYNQMADDTYYTAKELGVAPATMTAMVRRELVEKTEDTPRRYRKLKSNLPLILSFWEDKGKPDFFALYDSDRTIGMLCTVKNNKVIDAYDREYDTSNSTLISFGQDYYDLKTRARAEWLGIH